MQTVTPRGGPFDPDDDDSFAAWSRARRAARPADPSDLVVPMAEPATPSATERAALAQALKRTNMAFYRGPAPESVAGEKARVKALGAAFGLHRLDAHLCADEDAVTPLQVCRDGSRPRYIPYTDRPINWHTDGYYNTAADAIRGMVLHCVQPAAEGGVNGVMDPEWAWLRLREADPAWARALMHPAAMTIPANTEGGDELREARQVPVFAVLDDGRLHMRYTQRKRNLVWRDDPATREAVAFLDELLAGPEAWHHRLDAGCGLLCANVLHTRTGFRDDPARARVMLRARYLDPL